MVSVNAPLQILKLFYATDVAADVTDDLTVRLRDKLSAQRIW